MKRVYRLEAYEHPNGTVEQRIFNARRGGVVIQKMFGPAQFFFDPGFEPDEMVTVFRKRAWNGGRLGPSRP